MIKRLGLMQKVERIHTFSSELRCQVEDLQSECEAMGDLCEFTVDDAVNAAMELEGALDELRGCLQM